MNNRYADSMFNKFDVSILRHAKTFAKWMLTFGDEIATRFSWNGFYRQGIAQKVSDPIAFADKKTRAVVAGRAVGEVPLIQKSKLFQLVAPFQLEVTNLWWSLGDMRRKKDFVGLLVFSVLMRAMNYLAEQARGSRVALDPILALWEAAQPDKTLAQRTGRILGEFLSNIPLGQNIMELYPEYGVSFQGTKIIPSKKQYFGSDVTRFGGGVLAARLLMDSVTGIAGILNPNLLLDQKLAMAMKPALSIGTPFGGKQVEKTFKGLRAFNYGVFDFGKKPVYLDQTMSNMIKGTLFGPYAMDEIKAYSDELSKRLEKVADDED